ncbi:MAG: O-antigen ligase family protein [Chloroflexi bacterium]|nr:O-antigen ligase family protein [Chloroflexota bacterium]
MSYRSMVFAGHPASLGTHPAKLGTRLAWWYDRFIEAGWLVLAVLLPFYFNPTTYRLFEPDKAAVLQGLVLLMGLAWVLRWLETGSPASVSSLGMASPAGRWGVLRTPIGLAILAYTVAIFLSAFLSLAPLPTWLGSYARANGMTTLMAALVGGAVVIITTMRSAAQRDRFLIALVLGSIPVAIYAVLQHYGFDPIPGGDPSYQARTPGALGNPVFLGAYLIMIIPITLGLVWRFWQRPFTGTALSFALVLQGLALLFTRSRGPWVGGLAALVFFVLLAALVQRQRKVAWTIIGAIAVGALLILWLNIPGATPAGIKDVPYLGRLASLADIHEPTNQVRLIIWDGVLQMLKGKPARLLTGNGPETMLDALPRFMPPGLSRYEAQNALPDRAHNWVMDTLATTGILGFLTELAVYAALLLGALRYLNVPLRGVRGVLLPVCIVGGGIFLSVVAWLVLGYGTLLLVAFGPGMLLGLIVYLVFLVLSGTETGREFSTSGRGYSTVSTPAKAHAVQGTMGQSTASALAANSTDRIIVISLLAALLGHLTEMQFGFGIVVTEWLFWAMAGALTVQVLGMVWQEAPESENVSERQPESATEMDTPASGESDAEAEAEAAEMTLSWSGPVALLHVLLGLAMATAVYSLGNFQDVRSDWAGPTTAIFLLTWLLGAWVIGGYSASAGYVGLLGAWGYSLLSLVWGGLFLLLRVAGILGSGLLVAYLVFGALSLLWVTASLPRDYCPLPDPDSSQPASRANRMPSWLRLVGLPLAALVLVAIWVLSVQPVRADMAYRKAEEAASVGQANIMVPYLQTAIGLNPWVDLYHARLGSIYLLAAQSAPDAQTAAAVLTQSYQEGLAAEKLNPLSPDNLTNLARLQRSRASLEQQDRTKRANLLLEARQYYTQANLLYPASGTIVAELASTEQAIGSFTRSAELYQKAEQMDPDNPEILFLHGTLMEETDNPDQAIELYQKALQYDPNMFTAHLALSKLYRQANRLEDAVKETETLVRLDPRNYVHYQNLALLYDSTGRKQDALAAAQAALTLAPDSRKQPLQNFIQQLQTGQTAKP